MFDYFVAAKQEGIRRSFSENMQTCLTRDVKTLALLLLMYY